MKIRAATERDFGVIISLLAQLNPDDPTVDTADAFRVYNTILQTDHLTLYVAELDGAVVASCYLNIVPNLTRSARPYAVIENVVTDVAHRRKGIGTEMLKQVVGIAFEQGCYKLMLLSGRGDDHVHHFYETCGFTKNRKTAFLIKPDD